MAFPGTAVWRDAARLYRDPRVLSMLFLGFSSGLPFGATGAPLQAWLSDEGVSKTAIGLFAWVGVPYTLKFLIAPFIDRLSLPVLTRVFGRRRGWTLATQALVIAAIAALGSGDPSRDLATIAALAFAVSLASASQDVVIDAYRTEILRERTMAAGAATMVFGYRIGMLAAGAGGLWLADSLPWSTVYWIMAGSLVVGVVAILANPEPDAPPMADALDEQQRARRLLREWRRLPEPVAEALGWLWAACACPLLDFAKRPGWVAILLFIAFYRFGDSVLSIMTIPFYREIGFSKAEIAEVTKLFGLAPTIVGGLVGAVLVARIGLMRGLLVCGVLMGLSNLIFVAQAWAGADLAMLALTVTVENLTSGMGGTAFVAYMSSLCNIAYTATQYALLTSLMAFARIALSSGAGWLAERVPWPTFFVVTTLAALPGLLLLLWMMRRYPAPARAPEPQSAPAGE